MALPLGELPTESGERALFALSVGYADTSPKRRGVYKVGRLVRQN